MQTLQNNGQATNDAVEDAKINLAISLANLVLSEFKLAASAAKSAGSAATLGFYADLKLSIDGTRVNSSMNSSSAVASNINSNGNLIISSGMNLLDSNTDLIAGTVGNTTITGANISSNDGDINITSKNNTTINASKDTYNSSTKSNSWSESITLGSTVAGGAQMDAAIQAAQLALNLAMSKAKSDTNSTTYNNSQLSAQNGNITINSNGTTATGSQTGGDTAIKGANLLASDITINSDGDLSVESLQNSYTDKSKSFGLNFGGGSGSVSAGINYSSSKTDRLWTDNQTSILGTNSITINTSNNTDIKGATIANSTNGVIGEDAIDGGNLTLNTASLNFENLQDHYNTEKFGAGFATSIGTGINGNSTNPIQNLNFYPSGSTTLSLENGSTKKEGTTYATIGSGTLNITDNSDTSNLNRDISKTQIITKDQITGALDVSVTIDNRILVAAYEGLTGQKGKIQNDPTLTDKEKEQKIAALQISVLESEQVNIGKNVAKSTEKQALLIDESIELIGKTPVIGGVIKNTVTSPLEGLIDFFYQNDSVLVAKDQNGKATVVTDPTKTRNYAANGINVDLASGGKSYVEPEDNDVTLRLNPTSGFLGNLIKSELDKTLGEWFPSTSAMARLEATDIYLRNDVGLGAKEGDIYNNLYHSENTIIGSNAFKLYNQSYLQGFDVGGNALPGWQENVNSQILSNYVGSDTSKPITSLYSNPSAISSNQRFVAVGPARSQVEWNDSVVHNLGLKEVNTKYEHTPNDPVLYLTAPTNLVNTFSGSQKRLPVYIPNLLEPVYGIGLIAADGLNVLTLGALYQAIDKEKPNIEYHDVTSSNYSKYLKSFEAEARDKASQ